jgi:sulfur-oxidizing protein SoxA
MDTMRSIVRNASAALVLGFTGLAAAGPEEDRQAFTGYFQQRFADIPFENYIDGAYNFDEDARQQWLDLEDFPPYEFALEEGEALFDTLFANGGSYADCFGNGGIAIRQNYPKWDRENGRVVTLELAINECRESNGEQPYPWQKGELAAVSAYMAYTSRDQVIAIEIPADDSRALAAYEEGKRFFYTRRGQLNMSCASCHLEGTNVRLRAELPGPGLGQVTHFPVYRSRWQELGTLHRRYIGCSDQVRATSFPAQSKQYRRLEYFHTYMSNGLAVNGPGSRK